MSQAGPATPTMARLAVVAGEEVVLQCGLSSPAARPAAAQIVWRKGYEVLAAGPSLLKLDTRYSVSGAGLRITNLQVGWQVLRLILPNYCAHHVLCTVINKTDIGWTSARCRGHISCFVLTWLSLTDFLLLILSFG